MMKIDIVKDFESDEEVIARQEDMSSFVNFMNETCTNCDGKRRDCSEECYELVNEELIE